MTITTDSESHDLFWSDMTHQDGEIVSFNVSIDGVDYSYPEDMCK